MSTPFVFSAEQDDLRSVVRRFLQARSTESDVRRLMASQAGYDMATWSQMSSQLGLQGLAIPEEYGGSGYSAIEAAIVLEEMGRSLLCAPYFASVVLAANVLLTSTDEQAKGMWLPAIADGTTIATLAVTEESGLWTEQGMQVRASESPGSWTLTGTKCFVLDGCIADLIFVVARAEDGVHVYAVSATANGLTRTALPGLDQTRRQARLDFDATPARLLEQTSWMTVGATLDLAATALAAEQVGGCQQVLDMSVEYAKTRVQFGRPIGSYQAIKHKCAEMFLQAESARSGAYYAAWCAAADPGALPLVAPLVKAYCSEAYSFAAAENIQIHGGIGFTWEHPAQLYFKRAKSSEMFLGSGAYHREILALRMGL